MTLLALTQGERCQVCAMPGMLEPRQRKSKTRRKRKALLLGQLCFMGCLMLLASAASHWAQVLGIEENNSLHRNQRNVLDINANSNGRGLLWADDENFTEIQGEHRHRKNCTEPGSISSIPEQWRSNSWHLTNQLIERLQPTGTCIHCVHHCLFNRRELDVH